jgi:hypothetical protein
MTTRLIKLRNKVNRDFQGLEVAFFYPYLNLPPRVNPFGIVSMLRMQQNLIEIAIYSENTGAECFLMPLHVNNAVASIFSAIQRGLTLAGPEYHSSELGFNSIVYLYTNKLFIDKAEVKEHFHKSGLRLKVCEFAVDAEEKKLAILCANAEYQHQESLKNPVNDIALIGQSLETLGFDTKQLINFTKIDFENFITALSDEVTSYNQIVFVYAGHGFYANGTHYLSSVESEINQFGDLEEKAIRFDFVDFSLKGKDNPTRIFILDSCRMPVKWDYTEVAMERLNAPNTLILFSTSPGSAAKDGDLNSSPFAHAISKYIKLSDTPIEQVFKKVIEEVEEVTNSRQTPWVHSSLRRDFMLNERVNIS